MEKILITGHTLTLEELAAVCRDNAPVALAPEAKQRILESRQVVDMLCLLYTSPSPRDTR